jgi:hypothetical protein
MTPCVAVPTYQTNPFPKFFFLKKKVVFSFWVSIYRYIFIIGKILKIFIFYVNLYCPFSLVAKLVWMVNATPRPLYLRKRPGTHYIGGWVGHRSGLDLCFMCTSVQGFTNPRLQATRASMLGTVARGYIEIVFIFVQHLYAHTLNSSWVFLRRTQRKYTDYKPVDNYIVAGNCECDNKASGSIKCGEFLE